MVQARDVHARDVEGVGGWEIIYYRRSPVHLANSSLALVVIIPIQTRSKIVFPCHHTRDAHCSIAPILCWTGEIRLDYHHAFSPPDLQQRVFTQQLQIGGIPITVRTREAEEDTGGIMKEIMLKDHRVHIHCFTDTAAFGLHLLEYFLNLHIGITGVVC